MASTPARASILQYTELIVRLVRELETCFAAGHLGYGERSRQGGLDGAQQHKRLSIVVQEVQRLTNTTPTKFLTSHVPQAAADQEGVNKGHEAKRRRISSGSYIASPI